MPCICHNTFSKMATLFSPKKRQLNQILKRLLHTGLHTERTIKRWPFIFQIKADFSDICTANICIIQSLWLFRTDVTRLVLLKEALTHFGRVTLTSPEEIISTDFPQNLFFHLWSESRRTDGNRLLSSQTVQIDLALIFVHSALTLPESEVFWLCVAGWDRRVMANLRFKKQQQKKTQNAALEYALNPDLEVCTSCYTFLLCWLPARWYSGSLCPLCGSRRFLPEQGWRVCSGTSRMPRHTQRWKTLLHKPANIFHFNFTTESQVYLVWILEKTNLPFSHRDRQCGWRCLEDQSTPVLHWVSAAKTPAHWEPPA